MTRDDKTAKADRKRVGIWIRVSTEDQAKGDSPEHHLERAKQFCEFKKWDIVEIYNLAGISGKSVLAQTETQRMLADIKKGHIEALVFSKLARLARNTKELLDFAEIFQKHNADLVSLQESIDTSSPMGRFFYTLVAGMAQWEREEIADRVKASIAIRAKLGKPLCGKAPYGYRWENKKLVVNPDEAPVRKLMYDLFLEHRRKKAVVNILNTQGYRVRSGGVFTSDALEKMLRCPSAKGLYRSNYTTNSGSKNRQIKPESEWVLTPVEPIVSEDIWERCNQIMDDSLSGRKVLARRPVHIFAGIATCQCGGKMYVPSNSPKYVCQTCRNKIPVDDLEAVFTEQLKLFFLSPTEVAEHLEQTHEALQDKIRQLKVLQDRQLKVKQDMDMLYKLYLEGHITSATFGERNQPLEEQYRALDEQIPRLEGEIDYLKIAQLAKDQVVYEVQTLCDSWPKLETADKRKMVETLTDKITVGNGEIHFEFWWAPSSHPPSEDVSTREPSIPVVFRSGCPSSS